MIINSGGIGSSRLSRLNIMFKICTCSGSCKTNRNENPKESWKGWLVDWTKEDEKKRPL